MSPSTGEVRYQTSRWAFQMRSFLKEPDFRSFAQYFFLAYYLHARARLSSDSYASHLAVLIRLSTLRRQSQIMAVRRHLYFATRSTSLSAEITANFNVDCNPTFLLHVVSLPCEVRLLLLSTCSLVSKTKCCVYESISDLNLVVFYDEECKQDTAFGSTSFDSHTMPA